MARFSVSWATSRDVRRLLRPAPTILRESGSVHNNHPAALDATSTVIAMARLRIEQEAHLLALLRLWKPQPEHFEALSATFGLSWPSTPNTVAGPEPHVLWLAPDTWALVGASIAAVREQAARALGVRLHHVSDVSEGRVTFRVQGPLAQTLLNKGCSLDFHARELAVGRCAQSLLAQVPILIEPVETPKDAAFRLYADISYARYLRAWFVDACVEFG
jgi:sarcosine oxidase subunit gamma